MSLYYAKLNKGVAHILLERAVVNARQIVLIEPDGQDLREAQFVLRAPGLAAGHIVEPEPRESLLESCQVQWPASLNRRGRVLTIISSARAAWPSLPPAAAGRSVP